VETNREHFEADLLVGADGVGSTVGHLTGLRKSLTPDQTGIGLEVDIPFQSHLWHSVLDPSVIHFWFLNIPFGYFWVFPRKNSLSMGVGGKAGELGNASELLQHTIQRFRTQHGLPLLEVTKIRGRILPALEYPALETTDRIMLVGDAAGLVDIFSGQGICYALESGFLAAKTVIKAVKSKRFNKELLSEYTSLAKRRFGEELRVSWTVANIIHGHPFCFFQFARRLHCMREGLFDIILGKSDYYRMRRNVLALALRLFIYELQSRLGGMGRKQ
jgi:flavin-dependent dehydrogenase